MRYGLKNEVASTHQDSFAVREMPAASSEKVEEEPNSGEIREEDRSYKRQGKLEFHCIDHGKYWGFKL